VQHGTLIRKSIWCLDLRKILNLNSPNKIYMVSTFMGLLTSTNNFLVSFFTTDIVELRSTLLYIRLYRHNKIFNVFGSGVSIIEDWSFPKIYSKFHLEIWTLTAWIFSESTITSISFPIQISKSKISQIRANTVE
jgi:hypothetical protein